jgi:4-hydroxy-tetrahydrodipicolinate synthase
MIDNFGSVIPAVVTPFLQTSLDVDYETFEKLLIFLAENGNDGLLINGTTGESPTTTDDEKFKLISIAKHSTSVPIMAGVGTNNTEHTIKLAAEAVSAGADSLLVVLPYYNRPPQEGLYQHYLTVAKTVPNTPIILYDIPGRSGVKLELDTLVRISKIDNIVGVKDATGDAKSVKEKIGLTGLKWFSGDDGLNFSMLKDGASGFISVTSHINSNAFRKIFDLYTDGDTLMAEGIFNEQLPIIKGIMGSGQGASNVKSALFLKNI